MVILCLNVGTLLVLLAMGDQRMHSEDKLNYEDIKGALIYCLYENVYPNTLFINESGLFTLVLCSRLPAARDFQRQVTSEVVPRLGEYRQHLHLLIEPISLSLFKVRKTYTQR